MSWQATAFVKSLTVSSTGQKINRGEKLILFLIADYTDPHTNTAWPSIDLLAEDGLYERRQVLRILASLEKKGFISTVHSSGRVLNNYTIIGLPTVTRSHRYSKEQKHVNSDISKPNGDISDANSDIAMSPEYIEPIKQPQLISIPKNTMFVKTYKEYPKQVAPRKAENAWPKAVKRYQNIASVSYSTAEEFIYDRVTQYAFICKKTNKDKQFIPHMATWLNQDRFMDEPTEWAMEAQNGQQQTSKAERRNARISETTRRVLDPAKHIPGYATKSLPGGDT